MVATTENEKSFAQRLRDGKRELYACRCGHVSTPEEPVYELNGVWVDCASCNGFPVRQEVVRDPETGKVITYREEEPSLARQVSDILREDEKKGEPGGGSKSSGRRPTPKRYKPRVEQDAPPPYGAEKDRTHTKRLCKMTRVELTVSVDCRNHLRKWAREHRRSDGTPEPTITSIRRFLVAKRLTTLEAIPRLEYGEPKEPLQARLTTEELALLDRVAAAFEVSRGEVIEAGVWEFLK